MTIGLWLIPAVITAAGFGLARWMNHGAGKGPLDWIVSGLNYLIFGVVPSLASWLVWAIWRLV